MAIPEGAQVSEDGQYWWDGEHWQAVTDDVAGAGGEAQDGMLSEDGNYRWDANQRTWQAIDVSAAGGAGAGTCVIGFVDAVFDGQSLGMGPLVLIDTADNPDNHHVKHVDAGCVAAWGEGNGGTADCTYDDTWQLDGGAVNQLPGLNLPPGTTTVRSVPLGRLSKGKHKFEVTLNGAAYGSNEFEVEG